jgi:diguanylate cyclase (GGDEF)-like protein/PAS domain S-box-containing protein
MHAPVPSSRRARTAIRAAVALAAATLVAAHVWQPIDVLADGTTFVGLAGAAAMAWLGAWRAPRAARLLPRLLATGITISLVGYAYYVGGVGDRATRISVANIGWLAGDVALAVAVFIVLARSSGKARLSADTAIDVLTVLTVAGFLVWELGVDHLAAGVSLLAVTRVVWPAHPVADAALVVLVLRALADRRCRATLGLSFAAGAVCWLAADLAFFFLRTTGGHLPAVIEVGWMLGTMLVSRGAWHRPKATTERETRAADPSHGLGRIAIGILPLPLPLSLELLGRSGGHILRPAPAFLATGILLALAFARTARLLRSEQLARAEALQSRRRHACLAANSSDAVVVVDLDGRLMEDSPQLAALVGFDGSTAGVDAVRLLAPVFVSELRALLVEVAATPGHVVNAEIQVRAASGDDVWMTARIANKLDDPDVCGVIIALQNVSGRKLAERELSHQAFHDALTGLPNRALFRDRVNHALRRAKRTGVHAAVLYIDLDGFKAVNDTLGHERGDDLLQQVANRLKAAVRADDTVARLGGDEFAVLIDQSPYPSAASVPVAQQILEALVVPFDVGGSMIEISASVGIAVADGGSTASTLLGNADLAMYSAKLNGKTTFVRYHPSMRAAAMQHLQLETDVRQAVARGELRVLYQPVVRLTTEEVVGFEALLRWDHPTLGAVSPDVFIPIAEENGSIAAIGEWVLRTACATGARWQRDHPRRSKLTMAVNLSARQLAHPGLLTTVADALDASGLDPATLVLEVTETALVEDPVGAAWVLHALHDLGVRLAIDDFGTGYSSLSYLSTFPVDILKVDKSFVDGITDRDRVPAIVRGMLELGRTLDLEMVAEGVEDEIQRDGLRANRCDLAQGYLFARPLDADAAHALLASGGVSPRSAERSHDVLHAIPRGGPTYVARSEDVRLRDSLPA